MSRCFQDCATSVRFRTMFGPDELALSLAAPVPHVLGDAEVLPNTFGLPVTAEGKHPEHIVDQVEKALYLEVN